MGFWGGKKRRASRWFWKAVEVRLRRLTGSIRLIGHTFLGGGERERKDVVWFCQEIQSNCTEVWVMTGKIRFNYTYAGFDRVPPRSYDWFLFLFLTGNGTDPG